MSSAHFDFRSTWRIPASSDSVFSALADFASYSLWWPAVRSTTIVDGRYRTVCRAVLPYSLHIDIVQGAFDPERGLIEGLLSGDLVGRSMWRVGAESGAAVLHYEQSVAVTKPVLRRILPLARTAMIANHHLMMKSGKRGLTAHLRTPAAGCGKGMIRH